MILGDSGGLGPMTDQTAVKATLDDLFQAALARRPHAVALADPADRANFTDGAPRRLTYAQADRAITALAARLRGFGLPTDSVVAIQLPNIVEGVIALLAVMRAGLIAAPLPQLWRHADAAAALSRVAARALICCQRVGDAVHGDLAMHIAMETFTIRFLCGFGNDLPDGVVPIDDIFASHEEPPAIERPGAAADHVALVTFDVTAEGIVPVARSHAELLAAGLAVTLEAGIVPETALLGALAPGSFASVATAIVPWLLSGGALVLHQPFTPEVFARQHRDEHCAVAALPGALVNRLAEAGMLDGMTALAVWRAPERMAASAASSGTVFDVSVVDVPVFGEIGLVAMRRDATGKPFAIPAGRHLAADIHVLTVARTASGTIALSGPMVPRAPFPPGAERGHALRLKITNGEIDTGYSCAIDRAANLLTVNGPPAGIVSVGGYRFPLRALQELLARIEDGSTLAALPDTLAGYRLAGSGADRDAICEALLAHGVNPLLVAAFRARRPPQASAA